MPSLTVSGNEITDATRAANVQGDGLAADSSFGIWEATTNLCTNGGIETNTTGWGTAGATISRSTANYKFGTASISCTTNGSVIREGCYWTNDGTAMSGIAAGDIVTVSVWVKATSGRTMQLEAVPRSGGTNLSGVVVVPFTTTGLWQRITATTAVLPATADNVAFTVYNQTSIQVHTFNVDGAQVEEQPLATPYVHTDGASATRSAARVQGPVSLIDETQAWLAMRVRMGWASTACPTTDPNFFLWGENSGNDSLQLLWNVATQSWRIGRASAAVFTVADIATTAFAAGDLLTLVFKWVAARLDLSVNGGVFAGVAGANIPVLAATTFDIGSSGTVLAGSREIDSEILWVAAGTGTLSDADAAAINAFGNTDPGIAAFPGQAKMMWPAVTSEYLEKSAVLAVAGGGIGVQTRDFVLGSDRGDKEAIQRS